MKVQLEGQVKIFNENDDIEELHPIEMTVIPSENGRNKCKQEYINLDSTSHEVVVRLETGMISSQNSNAQECLDTLGEIISNKNFTSIQNANCLDFYRTMLYQGMIEASNRINSQLMKDILCDLHYMSYSDFRKLKKHIKKWKSEYDQQYILLENLKKSTLNHSIKCKK